MPLRPASLAEGSGAGHGAATPLKPDEDRFTLLDAMILMGATAVSAAVARDYLDQDGRDQARWMAVEGSYLIVISHLLLGWSLATLGCQAWRRGRRVARWPGTAACLGVFVAAMFNLVYAWTIGLVRTDYARAFLAVSLARPPSMASAVALACSVPLLGERWRPVGAWPDRLGRVLGWRGCWPPWRGAPGEMGGMTRDGRTLLRASGER